MSFHERFDQPLSPRWQRLETGTGWINQPPGQVLQLVNEATPAGSYSNAQIDDYQSLARGDFLWRPPVRLTLKARFSHPAGTLRGTGGFGFWNDPFLMTGPRIPALPQAIWFFYAGPGSHMPLAQDVPGWGWKAATLDAARWPFLALLPTTPVALPLTAIPRLRRWLWPVAQRAMQVSEALIPHPMHEWHIYTLDWQPDGAWFSVDGTPVLQCKTSPKGPLGLVIWKDTQFLHVTPWGRIRHGAVETQSRQWLELAWVEAEGESKRLGE